MAESSSSLDIYFMTGTGNSFRAASSLVSEAKDHCSKITMNPTDETEREVMKARDHSGIVAFSYPTHGFSPPWHMIKFFVRFPRGKGRVILINNRAGMKMGKIFTPGISGLALLFPMLMLIIKGYKISGVLPLDTPSNWISVHPGIREKVINSIFEKREGEVRKVWKRISDNRLYYPPKFFIFLPLDIFLIPISLAYQFFGRFMLARTYLADNNCDGCGICAARCPVSAIKMVGERPWWTYKCESCMRCSNVCPKKSVNSSIPLMVIYILALSRITKIDPLFDPIMDLSGKISWLPDTLVYYATMFIVTVVVTWFLYFVLFYLNRIRLINSMIAYSTPMRYWRRYLAPGFRGLYKKKN